MILLGTEIKKRLNDGLMLNARLADSWNSNGSLLFLAVLWNKFKIKEIKEKDDNCLWSGIVWNKSKFDIFDVLDWN